MSKMRGENFRRFHRRSGEPVRWWRAFHLSTGVKHVEQSVPGEVRVLVTEDLREFQTPEYAEIRIGDLKHSGLPDEIELAKDDCVLYPQRARATQHEDAFNGNNELLLPRLHIDSITGVYGDGGLVDADFYELDGRIVRWLGVEDPPEIVVVAYKFNPQYQFRGEVDKQAPMGSDGVRLPQIVPVHLLPEGDEIE